MADELSSLREDNALLRRQLDRERKSRQSAETLAEAGTRALYERQAELSLLASVASAANGREPLQATLRTVLRLLADFGDWQVGHIYHAAPGDSALTSLGVWHTQVPSRFDAFQLATQHHAFQPAEGFPGRVWQSGAPLLLPDLRAAGYFARLSSAEDCGLVCAFGFPIVSSDGAAAIVEFLSVRRHEPREPLELLVPHLTAQIGRIFEREASEQAQLRARRELEDTAQHRTRELAASLAELEQRMLEQRRLQQFLLLQDRALAGSTDAVAILDVRLAHRPIIYCNPAFEAQTGYAPREAIGRTSDFLVGPDTDPAAVQRIKDAFIQGTPLALELKIYRKDGSYFWSEVALSPVRDATDVLTHFIAIQKDVTTRRTLEERTRTALLASEQANAELARVARLKDEFLAAMSHELRTPLNAVLGAVTLLQEQLFGTLGDKQLELVNNIDESSRHLLELINDILDLSKIEADKLTLRLEPVELSSLARSSTLFVRQPAQQKGLKVHLQLPDDLPLITADGRRLKQILVNLLSNAVKFTHEGGNIGLVIALSPGTRTISFTVWDTGIGIAAEDQARLFQPFVQIDGRLARRHGGTGLGLALVRRLAELHGGHVDLQSTPGQGSRFAVVIPWRDPSEILSRPLAPPPLPAAPPSPSLPLRLLVAEDNPRNFQMLGSYLTALGCTVLHAANGRIALTLAESERPDLILMDIQMPEIDGLEAIRRIRATPAIARMPIIALTALAMPSDERACLDAGADRYMSKPLHLAKLRDLIRELASPQPPSTA